MPRQLASGTGMPQSRLPSPRETPVAVIDYEAEYNNRARVPEHPEIFARWAGDSEFFRADMLKNGRAELGLFYGDEPRQYIDLFLPEAGETAPLAPTIHGGCGSSLVPPFSPPLVRR